MSFFLFALDYFLLCDILCLSSAKLFMFIDYPFTAFSFLILTRCKIFLQLSWILFNGHTTILIPCASFFCLVHYHYLILRGLHTAFLFVECTTQFFLVCCVIYFTRVYLLLYYFLAQYKFFWFWWVDVWVFALALLLFQLVVHRVFVLNALTLFIHLCPNRLRLSQSFFSPTLFLSLLLQELWIPKLQFPSNSVSPKIHVGDEQESKLPWACLKWHANFQLTFQNKMDSYPI